MSNRRWRRSWSLMLGPVLVLLAISLSPAMSARVTAAPRNSCIGPVAGQHIYDCTQPQLLKPGEIANLEADAAAVEKAGAPTVVYLQVRDASAQQTWQDAVDLMGRWNVESRPGAHDGFVMFFNLRPGDLRHGTVALYAGEKHYKQGNLPQAELDRIREDVMTPLLKQDKTAEGIAAGLQMVAHDLRYGPPPPPRSQVVAAFLGRLPLNLLSLAFASLVGLLYMRYRRKPPLSTAGEGVSLNPVASVGDLAPALAGALIKGRVSDAQIEATILDFARRGLLVIEPVGEKKVKMRLLGDGKDLTGYEQAVWNGLVAEADRDDQTLTSEDLVEARKGWSWPRTLLSRELTERGWYNPQAASARRTPFFVTGTVGMIGAGVAVLLMALAREGWAAIGLTLFLVAGVAAFIWSYMIPNTTVEGEIAAAPWRGYRDSVSDRAYEPNLDTDLPYIVGMGLLGKLAPRLKAASERGYSPSWFRSGVAGETEARAPMVGFYPYWLVFHTSMAPVSSGSAGGSYSGSYSGGGAASGGGGSAGSF